MVDALLELIEKNYKLSKIDIGHDGKFKAAGMKFDTVHYDTKGLGSVSVMKAKGFCSLMQMKTVIVNPFFINAPLFSYDNIKAFGNNVTYIEMFNSTLNDDFDISKIESDALGRDFEDKQFELLCHDYLRVGTPQCKKSNGKNAGQCSEWAKDYFSAYKDSCLKSPGCNETEKHKKAAVYSDGLLKNGGPATGLRKKNIGRR